MNIQKKSAFPYIIIGLTILLAVFIVFTVTEEEPQAKQDDQAQIQEPLVSDLDYRSDVKNVIQTFQKNFDSEGKNVEKLIVVERALSDLLSLRVTGDYKDLHLDLATALNQMKEGLRGEEGSFQSGQDRFEGLVAANPWLE